MNYFMMLRLYKWTHSHRFRTNRHWKVLKWTSTYPLKSSSCVHDTSIHLCLLGPHAPYHSQPLPSGSILVLYMVLPPSYISPNPHSSSPLYDHTSSNHSRLSFPVKQAKYRVFDDPANSQLLRTSASSVALPHWHILHPLISIWLWLFWNHI